MEFLNWLLTSSKDPRNTSLLVKGVLTSIAPIAMFFFGLDDTSFGSIADTIVDIVFYGLTLISLIATLWGAFRKVQLGRWSAAE